MGKAITALPESFTPHRMIGKNYAQRHEMITSGKQVTATASPYLPVAAALPI